MQKTFIAPLLTGLAGFTIGAVYGGGKFARTYDWRTDWTIHAPLHEVYKILTSPEVQSEWWSSVVVKGYSHPPENIGSRVTYLVKQSPEVFKLVRPFRIQGIATDMEEDKYIRAVITGELTGVLEVSFYYLGENKTRVAYRWHVRITKPVLNILGIFLRSRYKKSHDYVMAEGEKGLNDYCYKLFNLAQQASLRHR